MAKIRKITESVKSQHHSESKKSSPPDEVVKQFKKLSLLHKVRSTGIVSHEEILEELLKGIGEVDFSKIVTLPDDKPLRQKHFIYAIINHLLQVSKDKKWNLCRAYDFMYVYNGAYWKQCSKDEIRSFLMNAAVRMGCPEYEAKHYEFGDKLLKQFYSEGWLKEHKSKPGKTLINLLNCTLEFENNTWRQKDHDPADFLTYQLPFDLDPSAECPLFDKYLQRVLPKECSRMVLQDFSGFIFTTLNLEKCLVLTGNGQNGKSVFFNVLTSLVGRNNTLTYSLGMFKESYNRAQLTNVLLNYSTEKGMDLNVDIFKALISGEPVQACLKYGNPFTLSNKVKFIINCNTLPKETESTDAFYRRFEIISFNEKISDEEKDISLADKIIENELPGVFNWLLKGLERVVAQEKLSFCEDSENAISNFRKQSDSVQLFLEEMNYQVSENKIALKELYSTYKEFCKEDNYKPCSKNNFSKRLESKGFEKTRVSGGDTAFFMEKVEIIL